MQMRIDRRWAILGLLVSIGMASFLPQDDTSSEPLVVFLVRHAEKEEGGRDPELSKDGLARSKALAHVLRDAKIEHVHSTSYRRTQSTAAPIAEVLKKKIESYDPRSLPAVAERLRKAGSRHLVVGHSNTTPDLVKALGGEPGSPIEEKTEYDRLYVVTVPKTGPVTTVLLRYGEPMSR